MIPNRVEFRHIYFSHEEKYIYILFAFTYIHAWIYEYMPMFIFYANNRRLLLAFHSGLYIIQCLSKCVTGMETTHTYNSSYCIITKLTNWPGRWKNIFKHYLVSDTLISANLPSAKFQRASLMKSQHWLRYWLVAVRKQVIIWSKVGPDLNRYVASLAK